MREFIRLQSAATARSRARRSSPSPAARHHARHARRDAARFAAGYRWRMAWSVAATGGLLAALFWGLGQLYPHVFLTQWAYEAGVLGIKTARWLFGGGA